MNTSLQVAPKRHSDAEAVALASSGAQHRIGHAPSLCATLPPPEPAAEVRAPRSEATISKQVFRPIQYLGSKLRSLDAILSVRNALFHRPITVLDPFAGSSVVAQAFALNGDRVVCSDALLFCNDIATAVLGVGMRETDGLGTPLAAILATPHAPATELFADWLKAEDSALAKGDGGTLIDLSFRIPQVWRREGASAALSRHFDKLLSRGFQPAHLHGPPLASFYAGTYFGLRQALDLDRLSRGVHALSQAGSLSPWQLAIFTTALCSAASACVFSAGKHFAQPYLSDPQKTNAFAKKRIMEDRAVDVPTVFKSAAFEAACAADRTAGNHSVLRKRFEAIVAEPKSLPPIDLIYADPPYTAQQYSRFYHILETIASGRIPDIQTFKSTPNRGLYPSNRYKSPFCSKVAAPKAFNSLLSAATALKASVLLSYSFSGGRTGNERMIGLDEILSLQAIQHGAFKPQVHKLGHQYRSFNSTDIQGGSDREFLILLENHAAKIHRQ